MLLGEDKHPVIVLKDVSIKYLLLILEYIYCGRVDLLPEDVKEFKKVAENLQIKVEFKLPVDEIVLSSLPEMMSQDTLADVSSTNDHTMHTMDSYDSMTRSYEDLMESTSGITPLAISIASVKSLSKKLENSSTARAKIGPAPKKIKLKEDESPQLKRKKSFKLKIPGSKVARITSKVVDYVRVACVYCDREYREKDRNYHQKFCWNNPNRVVSDCSECDRKYEFPGKLKQHIISRHVEKPLMHNQ